MKHAHIFVSGVVQGVSYRRFACTRAKDLGITGFVRNIADGRVEVLAEGDEKNVDELIKKLKEGPKGAKVKNMQVTWERHKGSYSSFEIVHM